VVENISRTENGRGFKGSLKALVKFSFGYCNLYSYSTPFKGGFFVKSFLLGLGFYLILVALGILLIAIGDRLSN